MLESKSLHRECYALLSLAVPHFSGETTTGQCFSLQLQDLVFCTGYLASQQTYYCKFLDSIEDSSYGWLILPKRVCSQVADCEDVVAQLAAKYSASNEHSIAAPISEPELGDVENQPFVRLN